MSWKEKGRKKKNVVKQLKIAVAGLIVNDESIKYFEEHEVNELYNALESIDVIVGHNLLEFDYYVLNNYYSKNKIDILKQKTIDTLSEIEKVTGVWTKLDDLGKLNLGIEKSENAMKIPKLWRDGNHARVKDYLKNDVEMTKQVFLKGRSDGKLEYIHKNYGKVTGVKIVKITW
jgi:DEAD/DEAH box helicase domain-containing protein